MTYTNNLNLILADNPSSSASTDGSLLRNVISAYAGNIQLLDFYISNYFLYDISSDSNISITSDSFIIEITDSLSTLTSNKQLNITSTSNTQLRIIKNSTNFKLTYNTVEIKANSISVIYLSDSISFYNRSILLYDIFTYIPGQPQINSILLNKQINSNALLVGGISIANTSATSLTYFDIYLDNVIIGYIKFLASSNIGSIEIPYYINIEATKKLIIKSRGTQDSTLADIGITLKIIGD